MLKNNIIFTNWELFSIIVTGILVNVLSDYPAIIIQNSGSASLIATLLICTFAYYIYKYIVTKISKSNYDFFEYLKQSFSPFFVKLIGIILFLYSITFCFLSIMNISINLKIITYNISPLFSLVIYFLVALFLGCKYGFKSLFRLSGYFLPLTICYFILIFSLTIPIIDITNFTPIFGNGISNILFPNIPVLSMFSPLLFLLFFLRKDKSKDNIKNNKKMLKNIMICSSIAILGLVFIFLNAMPVKLLNARTSLLFDVNKMFGTYQYSQRIEPFMVFAYTLSTFLFSTFSFLCGLYILERTGIVKDYKKYITPLFIILVLFAFIPQTKITAYIVRNYFSYISLAVFIIIPLLIIFKKQIKEVNLT